MTEWAAKVLEGVPRLALETTANGEQIIVCNDGPFIRYNHALAAIEAEGRRIRDANAKLAEGDGLAERLTGRARFCRDRGEIKTPELLEEAAARIAALTAQNREMALDVLASSGQAQEAYAAQLAAEAEAAALRAKVARLEGALGGVSASLHQLARDRDLSEAELDFMRGIDAALTDGAADE